jgi:hypothetical protein
VVRGVGNRAGRGRLRQDLSLQSERKPRAMVLSTAEQWPTGESINARLFGVAMRPGMVDLARLNEAQAAAREGLLARSMTDFIRGLAGNFENRCRDLKATWGEWRETALKAGLSGRTPEQAAFLLIGYEFAVDHWHKAGVMTYEQAREQLDNARCILFDLAKQHEKRIARSQPADAFVSILTDLLLSGEAYLLDTNDERPKINAASYGWKRADPEGQHIGWVDETKRELYLMPTRALDAVFSAARRLDAPLNIREAALKSQLLDRGFLLAGASEKRASSAVDRSSRTKKISGSSKRVLVMPIGILEPREGDD